VKWYLLKDRRQLGPFSKEEIIEGLNSDKFDLKDYLLPESAVKDQSSFAYVLLSSVVGPEIVFDIEKRKQKNTQQDIKDTSSTESNFKIQNKAEHAARMKDLQSEFEKSLDSSQLSQSKLSQNKVPATTGNIDAYSAASSFSQQVRVQGSSSKSWLIGAGLCVVAGFVAYQMGVFEAKVPQGSVSQQANSLPQQGSPRMSRPTVNYPMNNPMSNPMNYPSAARGMVQNPRPSYNRMPSSQIQLPAPTVRNVEENVPVVHTEEVVSDSNEPVAQRNPAMMKKLLRQKMRNRRNGNASSDEDPGAENENDLEAAQEAEPGNDDENNAE
jgi:hypothetical protein